MAGYAMVGLVQSSNSGSQFANAVMCVLRMQLPTTASTDVDGFCVLRDLTASSKVMLDGGLQLSVGVAMTLIYIAVALAERLLRSFQCCLRGEIKPLTKTTRFDSYSTFYGESSVDCDTTTHTPILDPHDVLNTRSKMIAAAVNLPSPPTRR